MSAALHRLKIRHNSGLYDAWQIVLSHRTKLVQFSTLSQNKHVKYLKPPLYEKHYDVDNQIRWFYWAIKAFWLIKKNLVYEYFILLCNLVGTVLKILYLSPLIKTILTLKRQRLTQYWLDLLIKIIYAWKFFGQP